MGTVTEGCGRVVAREEGRYWNIYWMPPDGVGGGQVLLGSLVMQAALRFPARKSEFLSLMVNVVGDLITGSTGYRPVWGDVVASPEHERAGHG